MEKEYFICPQCNLIIKINKTKLKTKLQIDIILYLQDHYATCTTIELANKFYLSRRNAQLYLRDFLEIYHPELLPKKRGRPEGSLNKKKTEASASVVKED